MDRNDNPEDVLLAFSIAHPLPTDEDVAAAVTRHPEHERLIRDYAAEVIADALDPGLGEESSPTDERERMIARRARDLTSRLVEQSKAAGHDVVPMDRSRIAGVASERGGWVDR